MKVLWSTTTSVGYFEFFPGNNGSRWMKVLEVDVRKKARIELKSPVYKRF
jgi:hypothetical protein|tara:strand:+ start:84 stop:233 length:150 start_codon:yes stop_codon:yes gene_type:complete